MLIPLGTDRHCRRPTLVTYVLLALNCLVGVAMLIIQRASPELFARLFEWGALNPRDLTVHGFVTYQFLHGGLMHLLGNMVFLWVFGPPVEDRLSRIGFTLFYLFGGTAAGALHALMEPAPVVGASGSIAAVSGAFLVLFPKTHVRFLSLLIFFGYFSIPSWWWIAGAIVKDLFMHGFGAGYGVANLAHLGGYAFGIGLSLLLLWRRVLEREPYDLFSIGRQLHRRRMFKELTTSGAQPWLGRVGDDGRPPRRTAAGASPVVSAIESQMLAQRAEVSRLLSAGSLEEASRAYEQLIEKFGRHAVHRDGQIDLANHLFRTGRRANAAIAYQLFIEKFEGDRELPRVRLLLALIHARDLNDPLKAKSLLGEVDDLTLDADLRAMKSALAAELG